VGLLLAGLSVYALVSAKLHNFEVGGYALIASGGFSNWVDRARFDGSVVDFMNMGIGSLRTGVFNVADLAIIAGIVVLFLHGSAEEKKRKLAQDAKKKDEAPQP
jgi:signal peptidase II